MQGRNVTLARPDEAEYEQIVQWLAPTSLTAILTMDSDENVTAQELREANDSGQVRIFVVRDSKGKAVGTVNYRKQGPAGCYVIGGAIGEPELWKLGLGVEAFQLLLDLLFHVRNAHRVQFTTALYNKAVLQLVSRSGFVLDGVLREYHYLDGRHHDVALWSMLRADYYRAVEQTKFLGHPDSIPEAEKQEALDLFHRYLTGPDAATSIQLLLSDRLPASTGERT